ncbi:hypothetical protein JTE90_003350 [Oedothorax gibbosus]|uniref:Uncharacterized protein n=1 Tax=Oedothorax gibbosus TaxID=931172 RepID=A0AAV6TYG5_9ARAC|nr:hypothetical protein JTE90_003350 [Oedothorax gibbosus]
MEVLPPAFQSAETPMDIPTEATRGNLFKSVITKMNELHSKFGSSEEGLCTLFKRKVQSQGQWEQVLNTAGSKIPLKRRPGAAIHVQPTTIARRKLQVIRGPRKLPAGRPAKGVPLPRRKKENMLCQRPSP